MFTILLTLALPIAQAYIFCRFNDQNDVGGYISISRSAPAYCQDFYHVTASMAEKCGFDLSAPLTVFSFPFVQESGRLALFCSMMLFVPLAGIERRVGHLRFIGLFLLFMAASAFAQALFAALGLATGRLCGISPVALGLLAYSLSAWPDMRLKGPIPYMSIYAGIAGLFFLEISLLGAMANDFRSYGVGPIAACLILGAILGSRAKKRNVSGFWGDSGSKGRERVAESE